MAIGFAIFLSRELIPNRNMCACNVLKVIAALILNDISETVKGTDYLLSESNFVIDLGSAERCCLAIMHKQARTFYRVRLM